MGSTPFHQCPNQRISVVGIASIKGASGEQKWLRTQASCVAVPGTRINDTQKGQHRNQVGQEPEMGRAEPIAPGSDRRRSSREHSATCATGRRGRGQHPDEHRGDQAPPESPPGRVGRSGTRGPARDRQLPLTSSTAAAAWPAARRMRAWWHRKPTMRIAREFGTRRLVHQPDQSRNPTGHLCGRGMEGDVGSRRDHAQGIEPRHSVAGRHVPGEHGP